MSHVVASVTSAPGPINGNEHNSSPDFQFVQLPGNGSLIVTVSENPNSDSITFNLWRNISGWPDKEIAVQLRNNATMPASEVNTGDYYYIGDPSNADGQTFAVTFTAP